jgi:two-component system, NarL family, response regulator DevR
MMSTMTIRVLLLDDHEVVRRGVRELLDSEDDLVVVAEASDGAEALLKVAEHVPDVAVLDVQLPDLSGVEVCRSIRQDHPGVRCLMLTSFADDEALDRAVVAGASGYVLKQIRGGDLVEAIRKVASGKSLISDGLAERAAERVRRSADEDDRLAGLTAQERRILDLLAEGRSNREIANTMYLAEKTVKNYVSNLLAKMGMSRRTEAAVYAARLAERQGPRS